MFINIRETQYIKGTEHLQCSLEKFRKAAKQHSNYSNMKYDYFGKRVCRGKVTLRVGEYGYIIRFREENSWLTDCEILYAVMLGDKRRTLIYKLFKAMSNDIYCMAEYNDSEPDLLNELNNCSDEILEEYAETYLQ